MKATNTLNIFCGWSLSVGALGVCFQEFFQGKRFEVRQMKAFSIETIIFAIKLSKDNNNSHVVTIYVNHYSLIIIFQL